MVEYPFSKMGWLKVVKTNEEKISKRILVFRNELKNTDSSMKEREKNIFISDCEIILKELVNIIWFYPASI